jgi:hypothetical protein
VALKQVRDLAELYRASYVERDITLTPVEQSEIITMASGGWDPIPAHPQRSSRVAAILRGLPRFAVLAHAQNLWLAAEKGKSELAGAFAWRVEQAATEQEAITKVVRRFRLELNGQTDVLNEPVNPFNIEIEQVVRQRRLSFRDGTAIVFYVEKPSASGSEGA